MLSKTLHSAVSSSTSYLKARVANSRSENDEHDAEGDLSLDKDDLTVEDVLSPRLPPPLPPRLPPRLSPSEEEASDIYESPLNSDSNEDEPPQSLGPSLDSSPLRPVPVPVPAMKHENGPTVPSSSVIVSADGSPTSLNNIVSNNTSSLNSVSVSGYSTPTLFTAPTSLSGTTIPTTSPIQPVAPFKGIEQSNTDGIKPSESDLNSFESSEDEKLTDTQEDPYLVDDITSNSKVPQRSDSETPPPTTPSAPSTPSLRDRLSEKTVLLFNTISAVNNSKDKRAAVNDVVADLKHHVRQKSIKSLGNISGISTLAGTIGPWVNDLAKQDTNVNGTIEELHEDEVENYHEDTSTSQVTELSVPFGFSPDISETTNITSITDTMAADSYTGPSSSEKSKAGLLSSIEFTNEQTDINGDVVISKASITSKSSLDPTRESNKASASKNTQQTSGINDSMMSAAFGAANLGQTINEVNNAKMSGTNLINSNKSASIETQASTCQRELDQSVHLISYGLNQITTDPQLAQTLAIHGLGRLSSAVIGELEKSLSTEANVKSSEEYKQLIVSCLNPFFRGQEIEVQLTVKDSERIALVSSKQKNEKDSHSMEKHILKVGEGTLVVNSPQGVSNTLGAFSNHSSPQQLTTAGPPPPVYEPQNAAERCVVTVIRSGALALRTAAPYVREGFRFCFSAAVSTEREHRVMERGLNMVNKAFNSFLAACLAGATYIAIQIVRLIKYAAASEFGRKIGNSINGLMLAWAVGLAQAMVILAAGETAQGRNNGMNAGGYSSIDFDDSDSDDDEGSGDEEDETSDYYEQPRVSSGTTTGTLLRWWQLASSSNNNNSVGLSNLNGRRSNSASRHGSVKRRGHRRSRTKTSHSDSTNPSTDVNGMISITGGNEMIADPVAPSSRRVATAASWTLQQAGNLCTAYLIQKQQQQVYEQNVRASRQARRKKNKRSAKED